MFLNKRLLFLTGLALASPAVHAASRLLNLEHKHVPNQLILKPMARLNSQNLSQLQQGGVTVLHHFASGAMLVALDKMGRPSDSLMAKSEVLGNLLPLEYAEVNAILGIEATLPNDPRFSETYGLHNTGAGGGRVDADIDAPEAWEITTGSRDVLVGVIDTGIDYNHPDLSANYWQNPGESGLDAAGRDKRSNGIDDDGNGYIDDWRGWDFVNNDNDPLDDQGHGTHCAGTIGARGNDSRGVAGVNWEVSLVALKFLDASGSGTLADAVKAIDYATTLGVHMTSNSWGGGGLSPTMAEAISRAEQAGILFIAAAGNNASNNDRSAHYPSSYEHSNVIAVAATDHKDALANFSNFGWESVDIAAPGDKILSTTPSNSYQKFSGTSMATPHVAGVVALIKAAYPHLGAAELKARLLRSSDPLAHLSAVVRTGGRVNAYNALESDEVPPGVVRKLSVSNVTISALDLAYQPTGDDGEEGAATRYEVRYAASPIQNEDEWNLASSVRSESIADKSQYHLLNLPLNGRGYLSMRAYDNTGNAGEIGESVPFALKTVQSFAHFSGERTDGIQRDAAWGLESIAERHGKLAFSDSPDGHYTNNLNIAMTLPSLSLATGEAIVGFETSYELEQGYDFGYVELSRDHGRTWIQVMKLTGSTLPWTRHLLDLSPHLQAGPNTIALRFRMTSDYSVTRGGWRIDEIQLFTPEPAAVNPQTGR